MFTFTFVQSLARSLVRLGIIGAVLACLVFLDINPQDFAHAQEDNNNIEGLVVSDPVVPVEMENDLSMEPIEVPLQEEPIEVPLQELPLPDGQPDLSIEQSLDQSTFLPQEAVVPVIEIPPRVFDAESEL